MERRGKMSEREGVEERKMPGGGGERETRGEKWERRKKKEEGVF